jgi:conjugative relaxase-like TrwC/TraI family protein
MFGAAKMVCSIAVGLAAGYYIGEQSRYYTTGREKPGQWFAPSGALELTDGAEIDDQLFERLHAGQDSGGRFLARFASGTRHDRVPAYDLTFSAPKSVSLAWVWSDAEHRLAIEEAHDKAIRSALGILENEAAFTRRGRGGASLEKVSLAGAIFQHGEARPTEDKVGEIVSDPQLHSHAVIFNLAQRQDGSFGSLDGRQFFGWKMAMGAVYRAELAFRLQEIGYQIERTDEQGLFEISGFSREVIEAFSHRQQQIKSALAEKGLTSAEAPNLAAAITKATRLSKVDRSPDFDRHQEWKIRGEEAGFTAERLEALREVGRERLSSDDIYIKSTAMEQLTEHEAVFKRQHVLATAAAKGTGRGIDAKAACQMADELLADREIIELSTDKLGLKSFSTREMLAVEREVIDLSARLSKRNFVRIDESLLTKFIAEAGLDDDQAAAVAHITGKEAIAIFQGGAGSGKSYSLKAAIKTYEAEGCQVIGAATAWRAARQLGDECQIEARAIDRWLAESKSEKSPINSRTVLVIDEAGLLSSRQMREVLALADETQAKIIFCGDERQLQAVGAGPGLRLVAEQIDSVRVDKNRRQKEAWAREMVNNLANGDAEKAVAALDENKCLHWAKGKDAAYKITIEKWQSHVIKHPDKSCLVLAASNGDVRRLNQEIRGVLKKQGKISTKEITVQAADRSRSIAPLPLAIGDKIEFLCRNDRLGVINGDKAKIIAVSQEPKGHARLKVEVKDRQIEFSTKEIIDNRGRIRLAHGYASTIHNAQGLTVDNAIVLASPAMTRNQIYVAASRAKERTEIILEQKAIDQTIRQQVKLVEKPFNRIPLLPERLSFIAKFWSRSEEKVAAMDFVKQTKLVEPKALTIGREAGKVASYREYDVEMER